MKNVRVWSRSRLFLPGAGVDPIWSEPELAPGPQTSGAGAKKWRPRNTVFFHCALTIIFPMHTLLFPMYTNNSIFSHCPPSLYLSNVLLSFYSTPTHYLPPMQYLTNYVPTLH